MKGTMTNKTIEIRPRLLHRWGQLMCEVLAVKGAVKLIGITAHDLESQVDYMLDILKDNKEDYFVKQLTEDKEDINGQT